MPVEIFAPRVVKSHRYSEITTAGASGSLRLSLIRHSKHQKHIAHLAVSEIVESAGVALTAASARANAHEQVLYAPQRVQVRVGVRWCS
jgi:hypothetical protein